MNEYMDRCVVCNKRYKWETGCRCDPKKYDRAMMNDRDRPIEVGKSYSDKLTDGFLMIELIESEGTCE
jgi:hypothetical protein